MCICLLLICQPAVTPTVQKAKSPASQAPRDTSPVKLGPKGVYKLLFQSLFKPIVQKIMSAAC